MSQLVLLGALTWSCSSPSTRGGNCGATAACGGTLDGTWKIDSACIEGDLIAAMNASAPMPAACNGTYRSVTVVPNGTVTYANGTETSSVTTTTTADLVLTSACVSALNNTAAITLTAATCTALQTSMTDSSKGSSATCSFSGGNCNCTLIQSQTTNDAQPYTILGNSITYSNGDDPLDYCVSGSEMSATQVSKDLPGIMVVFVLHKA